jgi:REP element-mobilizing transposase RayT
MSRTRRYFRSGRPYELDIRVKSGLPFACLEIIKLLLESAIARAQRDGKVKICHMLWMGNHLHLLMIIFDAEQCVHFYQEIQKKITESMKRLLGYERLNLWEGDPILAQIYSVERTIERLGYFYANPAEANLVETIDEYPGLSSWQDFLSAPLEVDSKVSRDVPWIRLPTIQELPSLSLTDKQDKEICDTLRSKNKKSHELAVYPYAWTKCFGETINPAAIKERLIASVRDKEQIARARRSADGVSLLGAARLKREPIMKAHTPSPRERRIFMLADTPAERVSGIAEMRAFVERCNECYRLARNGHPNPPWPPGAVRPYLRPVANAIVDIGEAIVQLA